MKYRCRYFKYKNDRMKDPGQKDMEVFVQGLIEQIRVMKILSNGNINSVKLYELVYLTRILSSFMSPWIKLLLAIRRKVLFNWVKIW